MTMIVRFAFALAILSGIFCATPGGEARAQDKQRQITGDYQINQAGSDDCEVRLWASDGVFHRISRPRDAAMPPCGTYGFIVRITNANPFPTGSNATAAFFVDFVNCIPQELGTYVWPQQTMEIAVINGSWVPTRCPGPWAVPERGTFVVNYDIANGFDDWGIADGLAPGVRALKSAQNAVGFVAQNFGGSASQYNIVCSNNGGPCDGQVDNVQFHYAWQPTPIAGMEGRAGLVINCNGAAFSLPFQQYFEGVLEPVRCNFRAGVSLSEGAKFEDVNAGGNTYCAENNGIVFSLGNGKGSFIWLNNSTTVCPNLPPGATQNNLQMLVDNDGGTFISSAPINYATRQHYSYAVVYSRRHGDTQIGAAPVNGGNVNGRKFDLVEGAGLSGVNAGYIPGDVPGEACPTCATD